MCTHGHPICRLGHPIVTIDRPTGRFGLSAFGASASTHNHLNLERELSFLTSTMHAAFQSDRSEPLPEAGYQALRRVSRAIAAHHNIKELFHSLADELRPVVNFVFLRVFLYDEERRLMHLHVSKALGQPSEPFIQ